MPPQRPPRGHVLWSWCKSWCARARQGTVEATTFRPICVPSNRRCQNHPSCRSKRPTNPIASCYPGYVVIICTRPARIQLTQTELRRYLARPRSFPPLPDPSPATSGAWLSSWCRESARTPVPLLLRHGYESRATGYGRDDRMLGRLLAKPLEIRSRPRGRSRPSLAKIWRRRYTRSMSQDRETGPVPTHGRLICIMLGPGLPVPGQN